MDIVNGFAFESFRFVDLLVFLKGVTEDRILSSEFGGSYLRFYFLS